MKESRVGTGKTVGWSGKEKRREEGEGGSTLRTGKDPDEPSVLVASLATEPTQEEPVGGALELDRADYAMDGWHGWLVLAGNFLIAFLQNGLNTTMGLLKEPLAERLRLSATEATLAVAVLQAFSMAFGLVGPLLLNVEGSRLSILLGCSTSGLGLLSAAAAVGQAGLSLSFATVGAGFSLSLLSANGAVMEYFDRWRLFALTFGSTGSAVGTMLFPFLATAVLDGLGWRGAMLVLAGTICLVGVVASFARSRRRKDFAVPVSKLFQTRILGQASFWAVCWACYCYGGSSYAFFLRYPELLEKQGRSKDQRNAVMLLVGLSGVVGRLTACWVNQLGCTNRLFLNVGSAACWVLAVGLMGLARGMASFCLLAVVFGLGQGLMFAGLRTLLLELFGAEGYVFSWGQAQFWMGMGQLSVPPLLSLLASGTLPLFFGTAAGLGAAGLCSVLALALWRRRRMALGPLGFEEPERPEELEMRPESVSEVEAMTQLLSLRSTVSPLPTSLRSTQLSSRRSSRPSTAPKSLSVSTQPYSYSTVLPLTSTQPYSTLKHSLNQDSPSKSLKP